MTTPAVNIHSELSGRGRVTVFRPDGSIDSDAPDHYPVWLVRDRHRPASVSNPKNRITGWRNPSSFYHEGYNVNPCPLGNFSIRNFPAPGWVTVWSEGGVWDLAGNSPTTADTGRLHDRAIGKCLSKLKNDKVNLAVAFAERKETAELVASMIDRCAALAKAIHKRDPKGWRRALAFNHGSNKQREERLRKAPEAFLEYMYGVQPFLQDAYGASDALREKDNERPYDITVKAGVKEVRTTTWQKGNNISPHLVCPVERTDTIRVFYRIDYSVENPLLASLSAVGITNPLLLAWERIPLSFVADWFVPFGNWLGYLDADYGYGFKSGSWSESIKRTEVGRPSIVGSTAESWDGDNLRYNGFSFHRGLLGSTPLPSIGFKNPFPKNGIHIAEAIALLSANLR